MAAMLIIAGQAYLFKDIVLCEYTLKKNCSIWVKMLLF